VDGTKPTGLLNYAGVQVMAAVGTITLDHIVDAWALALAANVDVNSLRWFMRSETFTRLRKIKGGTGLNSYVLNADATKAGALTLWGMPVTVTNRIPTGATVKAVLADFSQIAVARDLAPSVTILRERFGDQDSQAIRVVTRYDAKPVNPTAIVRLDGITL